MLINENSVLKLDEITRTVMKIDGKNAADQKLLRDPGIYLLGHFNAHNNLNEKDWIIYPEFEGYRSAYGVCDSYEQILGAYPELRASADRQFVVTLTPIYKKEQPPMYGWRWHKWGPYIGKHEPQCEYLYDEQGIDLVYVFHIYEKKIKTEGV